MKKFVFLIICIVFFYSSQGQITAEFIISKIPAIAEPCQMSLDEKRSYLDELNEISGAIDKEMDRRDSIMESRQDVYEDQAKANIAKQYGISQSDINRMDGDMSEAEKNEMIDKMMQNSANLSMAEIQNLGKMDKAGQEAWMEAYSTEKMAEQSGNDKQVMEDQLKMKNQYELAAMQKHLLDSLKAIEDKFAKIIEKIYTDSKNEQLLKEIDSLKARYGSLMGIDYGQGAEMDNLRAQIKSKSLTYCTNFSREFIPVLKDFRIYVSSNIPSWDRLQNISERLTEMQTGVKMNSTPGTLALGGVSSLIGMMKNSFSHYLMSQHDD